ncbi:hypothetical protein BAUCODRAFT_90072 [Baudoinia panamericana UAMH 10762]|uniref:Uncharacterized protein n=1 Tax=Baudoinia panamericana (strain UAMH 10762) TaxID=717646 RepID=M2NC99_BAUPA|nr:uncharacterized protein BAUCODRAFT_90072 [Baudoinia panamericana UAMH 10762]EMC96809.1 hypothetical protein BAUCODRAFT_90072 [Baudoinia panamericana UAMH 10762]
MSQLSQALAQSSQRNHELLSILAQTDYAGPALKQNVAFISDLQKQVSELDKELKKLHEVTEDERKDHVKYRDSTVKRFAYKMGGQKSKAKFASKSEKEEREFLEAWQKEREAKERREELSRALENAQKDKQHLDGDSTRHDQAQRELDQLYNSIFTGPTPEVPGEDQMENTVKDTQQWAQQCQTRLRTEKRAMDDLQSAKSSLTMALRDMSDARGASTWDMWGGGTFADMMERDALSRAQNNLTQAMHHIGSAMRAQPAIKPLRAVNIDQGHFLSDVMFDNIFSDMAQHERIHQSEAQMQQAAEDFKAQLAEQVERLRDADAQAKQASQTLEEARSELQRIRAEAFERLVGGGYGGAYGGSQEYGWQASEAPPAYT